MSPKKFMRILYVNDANAEAQSQVLPSPKVKKGVTRIQVEAIGLQLRTQNWASHFQELQLQFDVVLDSIGAGYFNKHRSLFANPARIAVISPEAEKLRIAIF